MFNQYKKNRYIKKKKKRRGNWAKENTATINGNIKTMLKTADLHLFPSHKSSIEERILCTMSERKMAENVTKKNGCWV